ncbi:MAG: M24 family metallopeptidase [Lachnospirales bacterium]
MKKEKMIFDLLNAKKINGLIFFRPDELVMAFGYRPYWGISVGVYYSSGEKVLYIPDIEPKDYLPKSTTIKEFPWSTKEDAFRILYNLIGEDLKNCNNNNISFIKSIGRSTTPILSGEYPPLPEDFIEGIMAIGNFINIENDIINLYSFKDENDIAGLRLCHKVVKKGIDAFYENLKAGNSECYVAAQMEFAIRCAMEDEGVTNARGYAQVQSGINSSYGAKFNLPTNKKLEHGEFVLTEFAVVVNGYWADITRTAIVGSATEKQRELFNALKSAQENAIKNIKPNVKMSEIYNIAYNSLAKHNLEKYFPHALGHGVGFRYHDPYGNITKNSTEVLKTGMVVTIEPGIYHESFGGIRIEDNILVTNNGYENLSLYNKGVTNENK